MDTICVKILGVACLIGQVGLACAQAGAENIDELIAGQVGDEAAVTLDFVEQAEQLEQLLRKPIDLNSGTEKDFAALFFLSPYQQSMLLAHRQQSGPFQSVLELQAIPGFNLETVERMMPYVHVGRISDLTFKSLPAVRSWRGSWMSTYGRPFQLQRGYRITDSDRSRYLGTADRLVNRFRLHYLQTLSMHFNMKKDAGEPYFSDRQQYGFDHYSASIQIRNRFGLDKVILGDYQLQFGQGLVMWNGGIFGKGATAAQVMQQAGGLRPHTGLMETGFQRGIAAEYSVRHFRITPFASINRLSSTGKMNRGMEVVTSINNSGLHRTPTELRNRKNLSQYVYGANMTYQKSNFAMGGTYVITQFNRYLKLNNQAYSRYRFEGQVLQNMGLHYQFTWRNLLFFGESALSFPGGMAHNHGMLAGLGPKLSASFSFRDYQRNYRHFFARSFQDQSTLGNERGLHFTLVYHPTRKLEWASSVDLMAFPWLKFRTREPSRALQVRSQWSYIWYKKGHLRLRYQYRYFQENYPAVLKVQEGIADVARQQLRLQFQYAVHPRWQIGNAVEGKLFQKTGHGEDIGFMVLQDLAWKDLPKSVSGNLRLAYFRVDSYEARIFTFERDVLYGFGFPSFYRHGYRFYLNQKIKFAKGLDAWARYAHTTYFGEEKIGSGLTEIRGNQRSDFKIQVRYSW